MPTLKIKRATVAENDNHIGEKGELDEPDENMSEE